MINDPELIDQFEDADEDNKEIIVVQEEGDYQDNWDEEDEEEEFSDFDDDFSETRGPNAQVYFKNPSVNFNLKKILESFK